MSDVTQYQTEYITLCEIGNVSDTADRLFISDSNLVKHMRALEAETEHKLFVKLGKNVELTRYGSLYLTYAYRFKALDRELREKTISFDAKNSSTLKIALTRSMNCDHIVNMLSEHFCYRYPQYNITPGEYPRTVSLDEAFERGNELVFYVSSSPTSSYYNCFNWASDRLIAILSLTHPLAGRKSISISELSGDKFITFPEGTFLNSYTLELCRSAGFEPDIDFTIHGTRNLAELVSAGIGVSVANNSDIITIKNHPVATVELDPPPMAYLNLYYKKDVPLSVPAETFLNYAMDMHDNHSDLIPFLGPEGEVGNPFFK